MKNNKGFTLAELLGVITLIAIIAIIAVPAVNGVSKNIKKNLCESKIKNATVQAVAYAEDGESLSGGYVTIEKLIDTKYLVSDEENKATYYNEYQKTEMLDVKIYVTYENNRYSVTKTEYDKLIKANCSDN